MHSYERTAPMNDYEIDPCGAVHITIGDGGNSEGSSFFKNQVGKLNHTSGLEVEIKLMKLHSHFDFTFDFDFDFDSDFIVCCKTW